MGSTEKFIRNKENKMYDGNAYIFETREFHMLMNILISLHPKSPTNPANPVYIGWKEIEFENVGTIKVLNNLNLYQVDGKYYIADKPIDDALSKVYYTQIETDVFGEGWKNTESNYFTDNLCFL